MMQSAETERPGGGKVLGFPMRGFGLISGLLLSIAAAFFTFFVATGIAIFALLVWNLGGHHSVDFANTYRYVGLPAGLIVLVVALPLFGALWLRDKLRR